MRQSESIKELAGALAKAQGLMRAAVKDSTNPHFKSSYADLASVWDACREPLAANGLAVVQFPGEFTGNTLKLTTILMHSSGEFLDEEFTLPVSKADPQGVGSALTYARRYALAAVVGIYQDDDDGNAATKSRRDEPAPRTATAPRNTPPPADLPRGESPKGKAPTREQIRAAIAEREARLDPAIATAAYAETIGNDKTLDECSDEALRKYSLMLKSKIEAGAAKAA